MAAKPISAFARRTRRTGRPGVADCVCQRGQFDDSPGRGAFARNGIAGFDWRRTLAAGATGYGGKRLGGFSCRGNRRSICVVGRAVRSEHDQSQQ